MPSAVQHVTGLLGFLVQGRDGQSLRPLGLQVSWVEDERRTVESALMVLTGLRAWTAPTCHKHAPVGKQVDMDGSNLPASVRTRDVVRAFEGVGQVFERDDRAPSPVFHQTPFGGLGLPLVLHSAGIIASANRLKHKP
jgi:hypothetical protein